MEQAQVQVRIVVADSGGAGGGASGSGSGGQSGGGPGAASRQPVGAASATARNSTLTPDELRQLKELVAERKREQTGSKKTKTEKKDPTGIELTGNLGRAVNSFGLVQNPQTLSDLLIAISDVMPGRGVGMLSPRGAVIKAANGLAAFNAAEMYASVLKSAVADAAPMILISVLGALGIKKDSAFAKAALAESSSISAKVENAFQVINRDNIQQAYDASKAMMVARVRLGGDVDSAVVESNFNQQYDVTRQRKEIEAYLARDVKQDKVFDMLNALRSAALSKLGN